MVETGDTPPLHDPMAEIERHLMASYLAAIGQELTALLRRTDEEARTLLAAASCHASGRLTEVEARWHYLDVLHGK